MLNDFEMPEHIPYDDEQPEQRPKFKLIPATDLTTQPQGIRYLIESYIPESALAGIFAPPGDGKSFVALDLGFCVSTGIEWHGLKTRQGVVVYIAGEGYSGIGQRLKALELKHGIPASNFYVSTQPASLTDEENAAWVAEAVGEYNADLIIIDTLSRNFGGGDENSSRDMAAFVSNIDIHVKGKAAVLVVHHTGLSEKTRARGSSVLNAALDCEYSVSKAGKLITFANTKMKESEPPDSLVFEMVTQSTGWLDDDGNIINSIVLEKSDQKPSEVSNPKRKLSARDDAILTTLNDAIAAHGVEPNAEIKAKFSGLETVFEDVKKVVSIERWRTLAYKAILVDANTEDAKRMAFKRCRDKLLNQGLIVEYDNFAWRIY
ncbi:helicase RepA family protein [Methylobacter sp. G7]|uniref:helicase RepA family protein n=1 Tax=Methylobacter sp. G7 TaxID=3230117 RepID=UPI003D8009B7